MRYWIFVLFVCVPAWAQGPKLDASIFGDMSVRNIGPATMSGRITDIESPANDPNTIYVGTAGGGVWKSIDGAVSFSPVFDEHMQSIGCIAIDPNDAETIWVGTGEINVRNSVSLGDGLYKSSDGGKNWVHMGFENSERIAAVIVKPGDAKTVYVAVLGALWSDSEERGVYKTTDGGENWERILYVDETTGAVDLEMDPQEPDTLYAGMWQVRRWPWFFESGGPGSGLYKTVDGGDNFTKLTNDMPEGNLGRIDVAIAKSRPNRLYAIIESEETGLYRSDDMGNSWEKVNSSFNVTARPFYLSTVYVDTEDYNRVYNPSFQLAISTDGGESFPGGLPFGGNVHADMQAFWINPVNNDHLLLGTDGGVYASYDQGESWRFITNLPVSTFYRVTADMAIPYNVYGGLQDNGSWMAPSAGPGGVTNADWVNLGGGDGFCVARDKVNNDYVYWESQGGELNRLDLVTNENKSLVPYPDKGMEPNRFNWNAPFVQSQTNPETIYFGSQYLFKSTNQGDSWTQISPDLTTDDPEKQQQEKSGGLTPDNTTAENHCTIFTINESPLDENVIWVGTDDGNVQVTQDGGENWTNTVGNIEGLPANTWASYVWPSAHDKGTVYVTFDGHRTGDTTPYVYKSTDFGQSWTSLTSDAEGLGYCHVIIQDPVNAALLFLGTEKGLFVSLDDGKNWIPFDGGLPKASIRDMVLHPRDNDLILATHGRGIYILDDISPMRNLREEMLTEKVVLLPTQPARIETYRNVMNAQGKNPYVGPNPANGVNISYYLKRRHMFGDLFLEVFNQEGERVLKLQGGKSRGLNRVFWQLRLPAPKSARSTAMNFGSFFGPAMKEGIYKVVLTKGDDTFETEVELLPPINNKHSQADRDLQFETVMKLYRMQENLNFLSDQMRDLIEQIEGRLEQTDRKRLVSDLEERKQALSDKRSKILDDDSSIFASKERLRDDVINLYGRVVSYQGRPSQDQLDQAEILAETVASFTNEATPLLSIDELNEELTKRDLEPLKVLDRAKWEADANSVQGSYFAPTSKASKFFFRNFQSLLNIFPAAL